MKPEIDEQRRRLTLAGLAAYPLVKSNAFASSGERSASPSRVVEFDAQVSRDGQRSVTAPINIDVSKTVIIVCDMQNDFGAKGGMFDRAGIDISMIQAAVGPTAKVLASARHAGVKIVYLKMGFRPDLSDLGAADSVNRVRHL